MSRRREEEKEEEEEEVNKHQKERAGGVLPNREVNFWPQQPTGTTLCTVLSLLEYCNVLLYYICLAILLMTSSQSASNAVNNTCRTVYRVNEREDTDNIAVDTVIERRQRQVTDNRSVNVCDLSNSLHPRVNHVLQRLLLARLRQPTLGRRDVQNFLLGRA